MNKQYSIKRETLYILEIRAGLSCGGAIKWINCSSVSWFVQQLL